MLGFTLQSAVQWFHFTVSPNRVDLTPSNRKSDFFLFDATGEKKFILDSSLFRRWTLIFHNCYQALIHDSWVVIMKKLIFNIIINCVDFSSATILKYPFKKSDFFPSLFLSYYITSVLLDRSMLFNSKYFLQLDELTLWW